MRTCCVPLCTTGYKSDIKKRKANGEKLLSMFSLPTEPALLNRWEIMIKREDRRLTPKDVVCELHFHETDVIKYFETKLPDGSILKMERDKPKLKQGAVPTLFVFRPPPKFRKAPAARSAWNTKNDAAMDIENVLDQVPIFEDVEHFSAVEVEHGDPLISLENIIPLLEQRNTVWCNSRLPDGRLMVLDVCLTDLSIKKRIIIDSEMNSCVYFGIVPVTFDNNSLTTKTKLDKFFEEVENMKLCPNAYHKNPMARYPCRGFHCKGYRCGACCVSDNRRHQKPKSKPSRPKTDERRERKRLVKKLIKTKATLDVTKQHLKKSIKKNESTTMNLEKLPPSQREVVLTIFRAARTKKQGMRYSRKYLLDSLLLKIKSSSTYNFLRRRRILPLPAPTTLARKIQHLKPGFGFRDVTFAAMKTKGAGLEPQGRRGVLMLDEMKIAPSIRFNKSQLKLIGFTDLGEYTPSSQSAQLGDHALVLMFQPFQGRWVQAIAPFLSKGAARGDVLSQLVMEAIIRLENAGFYVDGVVCDGASWNRKMWDIFGVCENTPWATHPVDEHRRLFFLSDFCHLVKNWWTYIIKTESFITPDGVVKKCHWVIVVDEEGKRKLKLRASPQLNETHIRPKQYQKMSVARAYKFFSRDVEAAMQLYREEGIPGLEDAQPTMKFMRKISDLIKAFSSRSMKGAIFKDCEEKRAIETFLEYLPGVEDSMSKQTHYGFKITCRAALALIDFLHDECDFKFVMTSRFNQDNLERFFGMIRSSCGSGDHPDPMMFTYVYRLMSTYSLVRPPPGSNVDAEELFDTLLNVDSQDISASNEKWTITRNQILTQMEPVEEGDTIAVVSEDEKIAQYVAGRVAHQVGKFKKCLNCAASVQSEAEPTGLIQMKDYYKALINPSNSLYHLIQMLEQLIQDRIVDVSSLSPDSFFQITEALEDLPIPEVGCNDHKHQVTPYIVRQYITMRLHFITDEINREITSKKSAEMRKMGKLVGWSLVLDAYLQTAPYLFENIDQLLTMDPFLSSEHDPTVLPLPFLLFNGVYFVNLHNITSIYSIYPLIPKVIYPPTNFPVKSNQFLNLYLIHKIT